MHCYAKDRLPMKAPGTCLNTGSSMRGAAHLMRGRFVQLVSGVKP